MLRYFTPTQISDNISETPEGFLLCVGVPLTRTGSLVYSAEETPLTPDSSGKVVMHRTDEEVFHPDAMASFEGKPVTINHPDDDVDPDNWQELAAGVVQNVRRGDGDASDLMLGDLLITRADAISLVKAGLRQVSCGYEAEYIQIADGEGRQTGIIGNHVALVEKGRAGPTCAIQDHKEGKIKMKNPALQKLRDAISALFKDAEADPATKPAAEGAGASAEDMAALNARLDKLMEVLGKLGSSTDADPNAKPAAEVVADKKTGDELPADILAKLAKIEAIVAKLGGGDDTTAADAAMEEDTSKTVSTDTAARIELLVPSMAKAEPAKDLKAKALKSFADTAEGKEVIKTLTGDKAINFKDSASVNTLFVAASEVVKHSRGHALASTKTIDSMPTLSNNVMTPEKINEANAKRYGQK